MSKPDTRLLPLLCGCAALAYLLSACSGVPVRTTGKQLVVLGFDGADPDLIARWMGEGHLPSIEKLSRMGAVMELGTTEPPESPVAWASFATGTNPGKHGIFDFLRVDRRHYTPDIGLVDIENPTYLLHKIPLGGSKISNSRKGAPFYKTIADSGIVCSILRMPLSLPPENLPRGNLTSGLGVPDIRKTWGTFFYFATDLTQWDIGNTEFGGVLVRLERGDGRIKTSVEGPYDPRYSDFRRLSTPLELEVTPDGRALSILVGGQEHIVEEGNWSDWIDFHFQGGWFAGLRGISRFYVLETYPEVRLYLQPISMDPRDSAIPISSPPDFAGKLSGRIGLFKTLGWLHETWGLNEEKIGERVFLEDLFRNMDSLEAAVLDQMTQAHPSLLVAVFTATDSVSHMFYRLIDPQHPRYDPDLVPEFGDAILSVYRKMDSIIGNVLGHMGEEGTLLVVSDHGFHTWRREFNTNTWLVRNGFLALEGMDAGGAQKNFNDMAGGGSFFPNVDWSRSKAYSLGLGGVYVNLKGREGQGAVEPGDEYESVRSEIMAKLSEFRDPDNGNPVIQGVYRREDIFHGPEVEEAPDLQLSFYDAYRTSWQTALGAIPESILVANLKKWSGDHCASDSSDTAGILFSNRRVAPGPHSIIDIAPTAIEFFGIPIPEDIDGHPLPIQGPLSESGRKY